MVDIGRTNHVQAMPSASCRWLKIPTGVTEDTAFLLEEKSFTKVLLRADLPFSCVMRKDSKKGRV